MRKVLSVILSLLMLLCVLPVSGIAAKDYTPATEYAAYDADKVFSNDAEYIESISVDQIAGILLDYIDRLLAGVDVNVSYEGFEIGTLDMLDVDTLTKWAYDAIGSKTLGGDFDNLDPSALGHTPVTVAGKAPTCTESGLTDGVVCEVCKTVITAQETVPALGHSDADNDNTCDICGATIKKLTFIDKLKAFFQKILDWFKNLFK